MLEKRIVFFTYLGLLLIRVWETRCVSLKGPHLMIDRIKDAQTIAVKLWYSI